MLLFMRVSAFLRRPIAEPDLTECVRFATLAANSHNTQPWCFLLNEQSVRILPDFSRRTPAVDPDDHHLFVSLGCAAENFLIAARAQGLHGELAFDASGEGAVDIELKSGPVQTDDLYAAIPNRQSTRSVYDGRSVLSDELKQLQQVAEMDGVSVLWVTDPVQLKVVTDFVLQANDAQMDDAAFMRELKQWIRFNPAEALNTRDGLFGACVGSPSVPGWLGRSLFKLLLRKKPEREKFARQIRSSAGVAVFFGEREDRAHWVQVGRSFQRFALQATALGIRHAHINQPIEVLSLRPLFAHALGLGDVRPDLVIRFGYAEPMPMSIRRPVEDVIAVAE